MKTSTSLLEQAKSVEMRKVRTQSMITDQHIELAVAWIKGEILLKQLSSVLQGRDAIVNNTKGLVTVAYAIKRAYEAGKLELKLK